MNSLAKCFLAICLLLSACTKPGSDADSDVARILGTYSFDGKVENILSVEYHESDSYVNFVFSPVFKGHKTTYIDFSISKALIGKECDVENLSHNDDYKFSYENPLWYYSELHELKEGTICVKNLGDGRVEVSLDILLNDGTPFVLDYTGDAMRK